jgi:hypothetical protein
MWCSSWSADSEPGWATQGASTIDELHKKARFLRIIGRRLADESPARRHHHQRSANYERRMPFS